MSKAFDDEKRITHESFGLIRGFRISSNPPKPLFGSNIKHSNTIAVEVDLAEFSRNLHQDSFHPKESIIRIEMSTTQFSEFITGLNMGRGIPCTIRYLSDGEKLKKMESPPYASKLDEFQNEFKEDMKDIRRRGSVGFEKIKDILAKDRMTKADRQQVFDFIKSLFQHIESNMPFVAEQFNRQMSKTITEARQEIEGFVLHNIIERGLASLQQEILSLPEMNVDSGNDLLEDSELE
jgi:hypothetical protein